MMHIQTSPFFTRWVTLMFVQNGSREEYLGRKQVRDIVVNQWRSCLNWTEDNATMTVVWSFMGLYLTSCLSHTRDKKANKKKQKTQIITCSNIFVD